MVVDHAHKGLFDYTNLLFRVQHVGFELLKVDKVHDKEFHVLGTHVYSFKDSLLFVRARRRELVE